MENSKGVPRTGNTRIAFLCSSATSAWAKSHWMANFIEPQEGDQGAFFGEASKDGQAVFSILFVFKKPLEREGRVQYEITHRRWPS
jgi:hypothetical protein